jgi:hypothetical protein
MADAGGGGPGRRPGRRRSASLKHGPRQDVSSNVRRGAAAAAAVASDEVGVGGGRDEPRDGPLDAARRGDATVGAGNRRAPPGGGPPLRLSRHPNGSFALEVALGDALDARDSAAGVPWQQVRGGRRGAVAADGEGGGGGGGRFAPPPPPPPGYRHSRPPTSPGATPSRAADGQRVRPHVDADALARV